MSSEVLGFTVRPLGVRVLWGLLMRALILFVLLAVAVTCPLFSSFAAPTQSTALTWVSGVGDDSNPCLRTAPCKTFTGAIAKTLAGGEIQTLDPGNFATNVSGGTVTITKAITIADASGGGGNILVSGVNGITITAGATDVVNLRGLTIDGANTGTGSGIQINSAGRVNIEDCVIQGFGPTAGTAGISVVPSSGTVEVHIRNTIIKNNASGMLILPTGGATVITAIEGSTIANNSGGGLKADSVGGPVGVTMSDSTVSVNASNGVNAVSGASGNVTVDLTRDVISWNGAAGIQANQSGGGTATVTIGFSTLSNNGSAVNAIGSGQVETFGYNHVTGPAGTGFSGSIGVQ
jgi:hypothetical protein